MSFLNGLFKSLGGLLKFFDKYEDKALIVVATLIAIFFIVLIIMVLSALEKRKKEAKAIEEKAKEPPPKVSSPVKADLSELEKRLKDSEAKANAAQALEKILLEKTQEIDKLKTEIGALKSAPSTTSGDTGKLNEENNTLKSKLSNFETELLAAKKNFEDAKVQLASKEKELSDLKAQGGTASSASSAEVKTLSEKITFLESQLAEYEVIEEDIANLKQLQLEKDGLLKKIAELEAKAKSAPQPQPQPQPVSPPKPKEEPKTVTQPAPPKVPPPGTVPLPEPAAIEAIGTTENTEDEFKAEDDATPSAPAQGGNAIVDEFEKYLNESK